MITSSTPTKRTSEQSNSAYGSRLSVLILERWPISPASCKRSGNVFEILLIIPGNGPP